MEFVIVQTPQHHGTFDFLFEPTLWLRPVPRTSVEQTVPGDDRVPMMVADLHVRT